MFLWFPSPGLMFPSSADIHLAPFSDEQLYSEHYARASFWSHIHKHTHTIINPCMRTQTHWLPVCAASPVSCQLQNPLLQFSPVQTPLEQSRLWLTWEGECSWNSTILQVWQNFFCCFRSIFYTPCWKDTVKGLWTDLIVWDTIKHLILMLSWVQRCSSYSRITGDDMSLRVWNKKQNILFY